MGLKLFVLHIAYLPLCTIVLFCMLTTVSSLKTKVAEVYREGDILENRK